MPGMTGGEPTDAARKAVPNIRIVPCPELPG